MQIYWHFIIRTSYEICENLLFAKISHYTVCEWIIAKLHLYFSFFLSHLIVLLVAETAAPTPNSLEYNLLITTGIVAFFLIAFGVAVVLVLLLKCRKGAAPAKDDEENRFDVTTPQLQQQQSILSAADDTQMKTAGTGFVCHKSPLEFPRESLELGHIIGK